MGVRLGLNFHPDSGIDVCQTNHNAMAAALGMDPTQSLPDLDGVASTNQTYVDAYFKYMIGEKALDLILTPIGLARQNLLCVACRAAPVYPT
jgi:hypothetical protein